MKSTSRNITVTFAAKFALIASILVFSGYNNSLYATLPSIVSTELLLSDRQSDFDQIYTLEKPQCYSWTSSKISPSIPIWQIAEVYSYVSCLQIKVSTRNYQNIKSRITNTQIKIQILSSLPDEKYKV